ncbi:MAG TPA: penicillin-binding transpeptidase domain-containing protein [Solirubrobacteraceae bacterium]|nr:penicillin-binding transpeptidase domain-containing protein [Solirubrobacteraceae bacterium]
MPTRPDEPSRARRLRAVAALAGAAFLIGAMIGAAHQDDGRQTAERFAAAWKHNDYAAMHALLTPAARARTSAAGFAAAYERDAVTATAIGRPTIGTPRKSGGGYVLPVSVRTAAFGPVSGTVDLRLTGHGDEARVGWVPSMAFPGLKAGERLTSSTEMPPRASLLARDGTALAAGADRSSALGDAARAATGDLGTAPPARVAALRRAGIPDGTPVGVSGLERIFDARLAGRPGGHLLAGTRVLAERDPQRADDLRTTISPSVQQAAVTALAGRIGGVVAIKPATGEILAFAGIPFSGLQPPGSTFKIVTLAGVLQNKLAGPHSSYPYASDATLAGVKLANANGESCGGPLPLAFAVSCNSVFAPLGARLGARRLVATAEALGFNHPAGVPGAATSTIPAADEIGDDLAVGSTAIGQGRVQATTLQMTRIAATIALAGRAPGLTLDIGRPAVPGRQLIPATVARQVRTMMEGVVRVGTGRSAAIPGVVIAGKTGTAELRTTVPCVRDPVTGLGALESCPDDKNQDDDPTDTDAWFVSFAPSRAPRVVVGVLLVQSGAGGDTAAPAARQVLLAGLKLPR